MVTPVDNVSPMKSLLVAVVNVVALTDARANAFSFRSHTTSPTVTPLIYSKCASGTEKMTATIQFWWNRLQHMVHMQPIDIPKLYRVTPVFDIGPTCYPLHVSVHAGKKKIQFRRIWPLDFYQSYVNPALRHAEVRP